MEKHQSIYGAAPIYGGIRESEIEAYKSEVKIGQTVMGGKVLKKFKHFVLIKRRNIREAILWKDLILGTYQAKELRG